MRAGTTMIHLKRVCDEPAKEDRLLILVERIWPRGVSKKRAAIANWLRELALSAGLRKWYSHDLEKWCEFRQRYWAELDEKRDLLVLLKHRATEGGAHLSIRHPRRGTHSALALKEFLEAIL